MAFWEKIKSRGTVEDRRGLAPVAGGISLGGLALILIVNYFLGGNPSDVLDQLQSVPVSGERTLGSEDFEGRDKYEVFASTVLGSNNDMWAEIFEKNNKTYDPPKLVLFRDSTESECGIATTAVGPHYCPYDKTIYLDETFFEVLKNKFGARGGDVAEAYVISHEAGHHAQNELGIMGDVLKKRPDDNDASIRLELQADCFAGLWVNSIKDLGVIETGEIMEAMDAAETVGDDRIQEKVNGQIQPETWTHGTSRQRKDWFTKGYETGKITECNTFGKSVE